MNEIYGIVCIHLLEDCLSLSLLSFRGCTTGNVFNVDPRLINRFYWEVRALK